MFIELEYVISFASNCYMWHDYRLEIIANLNTQYEYNSVFFCGHAYLYNTIAEITCSNSDNFK